jgi:sugar phosphate isomerase/epimerase
VAVWSPDELFYCSNVHPGDNLREVEDNVRRFIAPVRVRRGQEQLQAGLWLSNAAADELIASASILASFSALLNDQGIVLTSLNGFPYAGFHEKVVKEKVYFPHWGQRARLDYTLKLARLLAELMPESSGEGTISTLPLAFAQGWSGAHQQESEKRLCELLRGLEELERTSGKRIRICLEMEPGCVLETTPQLISFFTETLPFALDRYDLPAEAATRYLGVCFDVCHQAVMFEDMQQSLEAIDRAGIVIGKIQVSSALRAACAAPAGDVLLGYAEPRYLHQMSTLDAQGNLRFHLDLADALANGHSPLEAEWRIHFHVPIQAEHLDSPLLTTTREAIVDTCRFLAAHPSLKPHLEVETYTWGVLPASLAPADDAQLIDAVAAELNWLQDTLGQFGLMAG